MSSDEEDHNSPLLKIDKLNLIKNINSNLLNGKAQAPPIVRRQTIMQREIIKKLAMADGYNEKEEYNFI